MERQPSIKVPPTSSSSSSSSSFSHQLPPQEWELLVDDFACGDPLRRVRWLPLPSSTSPSPRSCAAISPPPSSRSSSSSSRSTSPPSPPCLLPLPSPRSPRRPPLLPPPPPDPSSLPLKDHFLVSATSVAISVLGFPPLPSAAAPHLQSLAETLLAVANRPNHGPDRHTRAVACECLRELELAFPLLLSDVAGHLWALAQAERTHAAQSYLLLLASVARNIVRHSLLSSPSSILSTAAPLVLRRPPFPFLRPLPSP
uniref:Uncharacterized protein n=1 Tax=Ananas comosus var. bracteatus TaxID=296719 RepID=A0A6V7PHA7_ANACO|nr:unnamed protein product [Ananas comosus var. bracteatus]